MKLGNGQKISLVFKTFGLVIVSIHLILLKLLELQVIVRTAYGAPAQIQILTAPPNTKFKASLGGLLLKIPKMAVLVKFKIEFSQHCEN